MQLTHSAPDRQLRKRLAPAGGLVYAAVTVSLALVFWLDWITGSAPLQHLYYLPIILASLRIGALAGFGVSVSAIVLYHVANPTIIEAGYSQSDIVQILLFVVVGLVTARLSNDARRLRHLATTDDLTGLHNLRSFEARLAELVRTSERAAEPLSMLVLDVDRLKSINDVHGHLAGAEAVRVVGRVLATHLPSEAVACRYGGDEFAVALPGHSAERALQVAGDLCHAVASIAPKLAGISFPRGTLSISVEVARLEPQPPRTHGLALPASRLASGEVLFRAADEALYDSKRNGRNRVTIAAAKP
jgi:diguanylate cyclase (GGDEF)-like protein